ncbi:hypothetical protein [Clostridium thermarum]|uniref:DUF7922 domain-containing protein n=1 Tax=Clostridium thermarum TaxID=1716543 RepID=UPI0013D4896B|nr:hypothetical protein [Clostridium thermarum]
MAQKKAYSRYFIILQQDQNGYSESPDKLPSGYTKLETKNDKCKVTYYVQNLKKDFEPYYMVLVCSKKDVKKLIRLGIMNIDEHGRAEVTYEYNTGNIAGSGLGLDLVTGAAVVKQDENDIISVMSGFVTSEAPADWRNFEIYDESRNEDKASVEDEVTDNQGVKNEDKEKKIVEVSNVTDVAENIESHTAIFDEYEDKIEEIRQEKLKLQEEQKADNSDNPPVQSYQESPAETEEEADFTFDRQHMRKEREETVKEVEYPIGTVGEFFRLVAEDFEEVKNICNEIKKCRWYRVKVNGLQDLCNVSDYNKYTIVYYPMISYYPYIKNHGHYLLGYKYDDAGKMKYIVYGIPGTRDIKDQPFGGKSGFVTWVSENNLDTRGQELGYWLMFYDFRTSTIVIPVKKP